MNPVASDVHINRALTEISVQYRNEDLVGDKAIQTVNVNKDSDTFFIYGKQNLKKFDATRANGTRAKAFEFKIVKAPAFQCIEHALEGQVTDQDADNADDPIRLEADTTEMVTDALDNEYENAAAAFYSAQNNYGDGSGLGGTTNSCVDEPSVAWDDPSGGTPQKDIEAAKDQIRRNIAHKGNALVMSEEVAIALRNNPAIQEFFKFTKGDLLSDAELMAFFRVKFLIVGSAIVDMTAESATDTPETAPSNSDVWSNNCSVIYMPPSPSIKIPAFAYKFNRKGYPMVKTWRDESIDATIVRPMKKYSLYSVDPYAGFLVTKVLTKDR